MIGPAWTLPMEAVRHCVDTDGAVVLSRLDCDFARFKPHQRVDLTPGGFVAYVAYEMPPYRGGISVKTVRLTWAVRENDNGAQASQLLGEFLKGQPAGAEQVA